VIARDERGFTIIELVVAMTLLVTVVGVAYPLLGSAIRHSSDIEERSVLQGEARSAVDRLTNELRQGYTGDVTPPIETLTPAQITFLSPDRATPFHLRRISYRISGGVLERATAVSTDTDGPPWNLPVADTWKRMVGSVQNPAVFTYLDAAGLTTTSAAAVRTVGVTLLVAARTSPGRMLTYQTSVKLRATR
jgi:prepilin-type N-terminal cleavage/methylation domain-containing protein